MSINVRPGHPCRPRWPLQKASGGLPRLWPRVGLSPGKLPAARHDTTAGSQQAHKVLRVRLSEHEGKTAALGGVAVKREAESRTNIATRGQLGSSRRGD